MGNIKHISLEFEPFLADFVGLNDAERGCYISIILYLYNNKGSCDYDLQKLKEVCSSHSGFDKKWKKIRSKFQVKEGKILHKKVTKELKAARRKMQVAKQKGLMGAKARWKKRCPSYSTSNAPAIAQAMLNNNTNNIDIDKKQYSNNIGIEIAKSAEQFGAKLQKLFTLNKRETRTFLNIIIFLTDKIKSGELETDIFDDIIRWAKQSKANTLIVNKKGWLVNRIKKETGYKP